MKQRLNFRDKGLNAMKSFQGLAAYLSTAQIEESLLGLIYFRVSQMNGCAFCLDMHSKELRAKGEKEQRLYMISAWRESDLYSERERAALAYAEAVTELPKNEVPDQIYDEATNQFTEQELIDLTMGVLAINNFNRINITFRTPSGKYVAGQKAELMK